LVESGFGRLRITADRAAFGKMISTFIDESFVFLAAYNFIKHEDEGFYKSLREIYRGLQGYPLEGKIFERHTPLNLIYAFHEKPLKHELFSIPKAAVHRPLKTLKLEIPVLKSKTKPKPPILKFEPVTFPRCFPSTQRRWSDGKVMNGELDTRTT